MSDLKIEMLQKKLDVAIEHLVSWALAVELDLSWEGWDEYYKDIMYVERGSLQEIRGEINKLIANKLKEGETDE